MIVESVPLQQKFAELEQRVEKLEKERRVVSTHTTVTQVRYSDGAAAAGAIFGEHWNKMWDHFHEVMANVRKAFQ